MQQRRQATAEHRVQPGHGEPADGRGAEPEPETAGSGQGMAEANPAVLEAWLEGVSSRDGKDGLAMANAWLAKG